MQNRTYILLLKKKREGLSEKEHQELKELLQLEDAGIAEGFEKLGTVKVEIEEPAAAASLKRVLQQIKNEQYTAQPRNITRKLYLKYVAAAAVIFLVSAMGWQLYNASKKETGPAPLVVAEKKMHKADYILPDGTRVKVNKGSQLTVAAGFNEHKREVYLDGEAFFDVVKNKEKPFIVHTNTIDVKVLGTAFNVRAFQEDSVVETALIRGAVEVILKNKDNQVFQLKPNEKLVVKSNKKQGDKNNGDVEQLQINLDSFHAQGKDSVVLETQWTREQLVFENEPLGVLVPRLEKWYDVTIDISEPAFYSKRFSGTVKDESINELLELFKITSTGLKYKIEKKHVTIYK